jgi:hypothetical protein
MDKASKAISLVLVGSGAVLLGYTAFRPRTLGYYGGTSSTQPSSYHGSRGSHHGGGFFPVPYRSGRGYSGSSYSGSSSNSSRSYSGSSHSSGTSRGGFGSSGRSSVS